MNKQETGCFFKINFYIRLTNSPLVNSFSIHPQILNIIMKKVFLLAAMVTGIAVHAQWTTSPGGISYFNGVGIGTSNIAAKLQINGGHLAITSDDGSSPASFIQLMNFNTIVFRGGSQYGGLHFASATNLSQGSWSDKMILSDAGNLGIGTSTPQAPIHISSAALYPRVYVQSTNANGGPGYTITETSGAEGWSWVYNIPGGFMSFFKGGLGNTMTISNTGNIGINTTATGPYKMAVEGTLGARKIVVTQANPWADYVFNDGYKLPSLDSVNKYIKVNHHLADIPSADSVAKSGIDLGVNQALLLKKIEELTLYTIGQNTRAEEQQKAIDALILRNEAQQREIDELRKTVK
jgi:hypothetical protein